MKKADIKKAGKLKDQAAKFLKKGKLDKALDAYTELEKISKDDLRIPQKIAEILLREGRKDEAVKKYKESAEKYREKGFMVQAIAIYKVIRPDQYRFSGEPGYPSASSTPVISFTGSLLAPPSMASM